MSNNPPTPLDNFFQKAIQFQAESLPTRPTLNFLGSVGCADNPSNNSTDVTIGSGGGQYTTSLRAGLNSDIPTNGLSSLRLGGPTAAFSIGGLALPGGATPVPGQTIDFDNTTAYPMTIVHLDGSSTAKYQISVSSQSNYTYLAPYSRGRVVYDGTLSAWKFTAAAAQPAVVNVCDFPGVDKTGSVDSTSGINTALAAVAAGGTVFFPAGTYKHGTLTIAVIGTKVVLDGATLNATALPIIQSAGFNFSIEGSGRNASQIVAPSATGAAFSFTGTFGQGSYPGNIGSAYIKIAHLTLQGTANAYLWNVSAGVEFFNGLFLLEDCAVLNWSQSTTVPCLVFDTAFQFTRIRECSFYNNGTIFIGDNCDGIMERCEVLGGVWGPSVLLKGPDYHLHHCILAAQSQFATYPDVRLDAHVSGEGFSWVQENKFGGENDGLNSTRCKIDINNPGGTSVVALGDRIEGNIFGGPGAYAINTITGNGTTATVTLASTGAGHGIAPGGTATVWLDHLLDSSSPTPQPVPGWEGPQTVTADATNPYVFTFLSATSTPAHTPVTGFAFAGAAYAINFVNPTSRTSITRNMFNGYATLVNDASTLSNVGGGCIFKDNTVLDTSDGFTPNVVPWRTFANGGRYFSDVDSPTQNPDAAFTTRTAIVKKLQNRIAYSETLAGWILGATVSKVSTGITDPWGSTRATRITTTGAAGSQVFYTSVDTTSLSGGATPANMVLRFWARMNAVLSQITVAIQAAGPGICWTQNVQIDSTWREYVLFLSGLPTGDAMDLIFYPGGYAALAGTLDIVAIQLADQDSDYSDTNSGFVNVDTSVSSRQQLTPVVSGLRTRSTNGITPATVTAVTGDVTLGLSGMDSGSNDMAGAIILGTSSSVTHQDGTVTVTFANPLQTSFASSGYGVIPIILATLSDASSAWPDQSSIVVLPPSPTVTNGNVFDSFTLRWSTPLGTLLSGNAGYKINYLVLGR